MKQKDILAFAKSLDAKIVETHISWVLLSKEYAYKIKKPVKFSFLDFSTLQKRKYFCQQELKLNQKLSRGIYKKVISIRKNNDIFGFGGRRGSVVDYAVVMKRLDSSMEMGRVISKAKAKQVEELAVIISHFHKKARKSKSFSLKTLINDFTELPGILNENKKLFSKRAFINTQEALIKAENFIQSNQSIFKKRVQQGFIRDVHGDLHAGNIFLTNPPVIFDRIEFNHRFRIIDIFKEIAMLAMDIEAAGRIDLSKDFMKKYLHESDIKLGEDDKMLLEFYMIFAANVRAKVILLKALEKDSHELKRVNSYFKMIIKYAEKLP